MITVPYIQCAAAAAVEPRWAAREAQQSRVFAVMREICRGNYSSFFFLLFFSSVCFTGQHTHSLIRHISLAARGIEFFFFLIVVTFFT